MDQTFMKEKKILPLVLSMSLPMVLSMAFSSLYNIVDTYFVAKLSEDAVTALSLVFPAQNLVNSIAVGFGVGINAMIAFYLGAGNQEKANSTAAQGLALSVLHGIVLTAGCLLAMPAFLRSFTTDERVFRLGLDYSNIVFSFSVIVMGAISFEKIFQAVGRMKATMISMICGFAANIVLDPVLIFGMGPFPRMGIKGAALATGIGQILTLLVYLAFYFATTFPVKVRLRDMRPDMAICKRIYAIGIPASLNMGLSSLLISALNGILAGYSQAYVLVLGVYYKLQTFIYMPANGIIQGIRPLVGYNYGAGEHKRVEKIYRVALRLATLIMAAGTVCCWLIPEQLIGLFTDNQSTIEIGTVALHIISLGFVVSAVSVTSSGALEGLGKGMPSLAVSTLRYVLLIIPIAFLLSRVIGAAGVWWAFVITECLTAAISYFIYQRTWHSLRKNRSSKEKQSDMLPF